MNSSRRSGTLHRVTDRVVGLAATSSRPSALTETDRYQPPSGPSRPTSRFAGTSHSRRVPSRPPVAPTRPSALTATALTDPVALAVAEPRYWADAPISRALRDSSVSAAPQEPRASSAARRGSTFIAVRASAASCRARLSCRACTACCRSVPATTTAPPATSNNTVSAATRARSRRVRRRVASSAACSAVLDRSRNSRSTGCSRIRSPVDSSHPVAAASRTPRYRSSSCRPAAAQARAAATNRWCCAIPTRSAATQSRSRGQAPSRASWLSSAPRWSIVTSRAAINPSSTRPPPSTAVSSAGSARRRPTTVSSSTETSRSSTPCAARRPVSSRPA